MVEMNFWMEDYHELLMDVGGQGDNHSFLWSPGQRLPPG